MSGEISPKDLNDLLAGKSQFALIDVRETGEYNSSHIPDSSLIPRRQLESQMPNAVPFKGTQIILCDDDGRRAKIAVSTLERIGYSQVSFLGGGINQWVTEEFPTEWGVNVPSKDFGERVEVENHVPEINANDLHARIERGDKLVILDTRTPEEFQRFCIPGGRSVPGGELALRITDITRDLDEDTTVIVNCAGRTRSIIGTRALQRMGISNVYGLENGTSGWLLAGYQLETGADRVSLPALSSEGLSAAEAYASRLADEDGVHLLDIQALKSVMKKQEQETVYLIDVRNREEFEQGHIPGFKWFPGGQAVQRADEAAVVKNATVVFACDGKARATLTASWFRQIGFEDVCAVDGGVTAWTASSMELEKGMAETPPLGLDEARSKVNSISAKELDSATPPVVIFVDTSQDFAQGHVPGAHWAPRGWLEFWIDGIAPSVETAVTVTCLDGVNAALAGATLVDLGYKNVTVLNGGMKAWRQAGLEIEQGLSGVMSSPNDVVAFGPDRSYADMMNYLRWEEALGKKYEK